MKILLLNGVNLNMLGKRNPDLYGTDTLASLQKKVVAYGKMRGAKVVCKHSNCEGALVNVLQGTRCNAVVLNAGAYSHYSLAIRDCIECLSVPVVEVHITDIYSREPFRHTDVLKDVCAGQFFGKGLQSYFDAIDCAVELCKK